MWAPRARNIQPWAVATDDGGTERCVKDDRVYLRGVRSKAHRCCPCIEMRQGLKQADPVGVETLLKVVRVWEVVADSRW